jgi:hypothetical protein
MTVKGKAERVEMSEAGGKYPASLPNLNENPKEKKRGVCNLQRHGPSTNYNGAGPPPCEANTGDACSRHHPSFTPKRSACILPEGCLNDYSRRRVTKDGDNIIQSCMTCYASNRTLV